MFPHILIKRQLQYLTVYEKLTDVLTRAKDKLSLNWPEEELKVSQSNLDKCFLSGQSTHPPRRWLPFLSFLLLGLSSSKRIMGTNFSVRLVCHDRFKGCLFSYSDCTNDKTILRFASAYEAYLPFEIVTCHFYEVHGHSSGSTLTQGHSCTELPQRLANFYLV